MEGWDSVRRLCISVPLPTEHCLWAPIDGVRSTESPRESIRLQIELLNHQDGLKPFLDEPNPDFWLEQSINYPPLECLEYYPHEAVRQALNLDDDVELDENDLNFMMTAWEAHNYPVVSREVRKLASRHLQLEEFDWYAISRSVEFSEDIRWKWKIFRNSDGSVKMVNGNLTWSGCAQGNPPPFPVYVGQELEYTIQDSGGQYWES